jgi:aspartyl-tRNA(Asn)/glutamyl-tRNA(Gln) amidotransferase subunit B
MQRLVQYLGVSEANMQMGHMRFEPNINLKVRASGSEFVTPIFEVKNLNSFRALERATAWVIEYQTQQVREAAEQGRQYTLDVLGKQNWGWRDDAGIGEFQRGKEEAHDYRYFPDPDLVPVVIDRAWLERLRDRVPELPIERRRRLADETGLSMDDVETIVAHRATADVFEAALAAGAEPVTLGKHFISFWAKHANERATTIAELGVDAGRMAELARLVADGTISATAAQQIAETMLESGDTPKTIAEQAGLIQATDVDEHQAWVDEVFAANAQAIEDALHGSKKKQKAASGFLTGQVMRLSKGQANPKITNQLIQKKLQGLAGQAGAE